MSDEKKPRVPLQNRSGQTRKAGSWSNSAQRANKEQARAGAFKEAREDFFEEQNEDVMDLSGNEVKTLRKDTVPRRSSERTGKASQAPPSTHKPQVRTTERREAPASDALSALQAQIKALEAKLTSLQGGEEEDEDKKLLPLDWGQQVSKEVKKSGRRNRIDFFLHLMIDKGASDFHLHVGNSPIYRQSGQMSPMRYRPMKQNDWERLVRPITPPDLWEAYEKGGDMDYAYEIPGVARFRVNLMKQHQGGGAVFRLIPSDIMTLEQLGLPEQVARFAKMESGLALITGPTGSGKSTTLAAVIDLINRRKCDHIITIEDPIEFVHSQHQSLLHQREVGTHTLEFNDALTASIREDPDLILVGEMRDRETMLLALQAAEKGMLVFGTLHTNSAAKTVERIINAFPSDEQEQVRNVLASTLKGVVSQQLLRRNGGGRVAALEILFSSQAMSNLIREGKTHHIPSLMQTGKKMGMIQMDESLMELVKTGIINRDAALEKAIEKDIFKDKSLDEYAENPITPSS